MKIVVVNGCGGSGKDTFEGFVKDYADSKGYYVTKTSMISYVKEMAFKLGWRGGKDLKDRKFLSDLKITLGEWNDSPFRSVKDEIFCAENVTAAALIFVDAREADDIDRLKEEFSNVITILIKRDELENKIYGNKADDNVFDYPYDYIIENNGTLELLNESAETFFDKVILEED
jgi:hypothetical protein